MKKECYYCKKEIHDQSITTKIGTFCCDEHYKEFINSLSDEEYIALQHSFCVCSDQEES